MPADRTPKSKRSLSARKAARTRAANKAAWKKWEEIDKPSRLLQVKLANDQLDHCGGVPVRFVEREGGIRLGKGDGTGILIQILGTGLTWRVWPTHYMQPHDYYAGFWEVIP